MSNTRLTSPPTRKVTFITLEEKLRMFNFWWVLFAGLAVTATSIAGQEAESFSIVYRHPENLSPDKIPVHLVKEGESLTMSCTSSEKFQSCTWAHPSEAKVCGIFSGSAEQESKRCAKTGAMSTWTVSREGDVVCAVTVDEVRVDEVGEWSCELQSYPDSGAANKYQRAAEFTQIELVRPATVELRGALEIVLYEGERAEFLCQAAGNPAPHAIEFTIGFAPVEGLRVEEEKVDGKKMESRVSAAVRKDWSGKQLMCVARQTDAEGNELEGTDARNIRVEKERPRTRGVAPSPSARAGDFVIQTRYPEGAQGAEPTLLMAKEEPVTFSCTSTEPWQTCLWKRPNSGEPCGIFSDDPQKSCSGRWGSGTGNEWIVRQLSPNTCTLSGVTHDMDAGEWNCELRSKPILNDHNVYEYDQQFFSLALIQKARKGNPVQFSHS